MNIQQELSPILLNLDYRGYCNEPLQFKLESYPDALLRLIDDAKHGLRIYELFAIKRPGDIKKYLWVQIKDVPLRVDMLYRIAREKSSSEYVKCDWPENECPYDIWDEMFYASWDDNPEDSAWLAFKHSDIMHHYLAQCFAVIRQTQQLLKVDGDLLIKNEINHIENLSHQYDYVAHAPFKLTQLSASAVVWERHDENFYLVLGWLLANLDVHSVAYRYGEDYCTFRLICLEQQRRAIATGKDAMEVLEINVLSNGLPNLEPWGSKVTFYDEGLGYGDLYIDSTNGAGCSVKELCEEYALRSKYIMTVQDFGQISGYAQKQNGKVFVYSQR